MLFQPVLQFFQYCKIARILERVCMDAFYYNVEMVGATEFVVNDIKTLAHIGIAGEIGDGLGADMNFHHTCQGKQKNNAEGHENLALVPQVKQCDPVNKTVKPVVGN